MKIKKKSTFIGLKCFDPHILNEPLKKTIIYLMHIRIQCNYTNGMCPREIEEAQIIKQLKSEHVISYGSILFILTI